MKRSKMIQLLTDRIIWSHLFLRDDPKKAGKIMLEAIEEEGMLPPWNLDAGSDATYGDCPGCAGHKWEPEDE